MSGVILFKLEKFLSEKAALIIEKPTKIDEYLIEKVLILKSLFGYQMV